MTDSRVAKVLLPDDRHLDITVQPKLMVTELMDLVRSYFTVKETKYFGIAYRNHGELCYQWLAPDKHVLEHELPKSDLLLLYLLVRFYVPCISCLQERATIELFYAQARAHVASGNICCDSETVFRLAALALQYQFDDFQNDSTTRSQLKKLPLLPVFTLREHPSLIYCEDEVIKEHKRLLNVSSGSALVRYMIIVQDLSAYGVHFYEVKDKADLPWCLGFGLPGISVFDFNDRTCPRKVYPWKTIEHLYFRDKKFYIQLYDAERSLTRKPSVSSDLSHSWFTSSASLARTLWETAVSQHKFYLHTETEGHKYKRRNLLDIVAELNQMHMKQTLNESRSAVSLTSSAQQLPRQRLSTSCATSAGPETGKLCVTPVFQPLSRSRSWTVGHVASPTTNVSVVSQNVKDGSTTNIKLRSALDVQVFEALAVKRDHLLSVLNRKLLELQSLCVQESTITGVLPTERLLEDGVRLDKHWYQRHSQFSPLPYRNQQYAGRLKPPELRHVQRLLNESIPMAASVAGGIRDENFNNKKRLSESYISVDAASANPAFWFRRSCSSNTSQHYNDENEVFEKTENITGKGLEKISNSKSSHSKAMCNLVLSSAQCYSIPNPINLNNNAKKDSQSNAARLTPSNMTSSWYNLQRQNLRSHHLPHEMTSASAPVRMSELPPTLNTISDSTSSLSSSRNDINSLLYIQSIRTAQSKASLEAGDHTSDPWSSHRTPSTSTLHTSAEEFKTLSPIPSPTSSHCSDVSPRLVVLSCESTSPQAVATNSSQQFIRSRVSSTSLDSRTSGMSDNALTANMVAISEQDGDSDARIQCYDTHVEISKSFQMADVLKYSQKSRRNPNAADT